MIIIVYLIFAVLTYGITLGYFQKRWPTVADMSYEKDMCFAIFLSLFQPAGLIMSFVLSNFCKYGLKFRK